MEIHKPKPLHRLHISFLNNQYEVLMLAIIRPLILGLTTRTVNFQQLVKLNADHHLFQQICGVKNNFNYPNEEK